MNFTPITSFVTHRFWKSVGFISIGFSLYFFIDKQFSFSIVLCVLALYLFFYQKIQKYKNTLLAIILMLPALYYFVFYFKKLIQNNWKDVNSSVYICFCVIMCFLIIKIFLKPKKQKNLT